MSIQTDNVEEEIFSEDKDLINLLERFEDLPSELQIQELIIQAYRLEKPLTGVEIFDEDPEVVKEFISGLEEFFYIRIHKFEDDSRTNFCGEIFLSRFKTLVDVALENHHLSDEVADLAGILYGYQPKEVFEYCMEQRKRTGGTINTNLIK